MGGGPGTNGARGQGADEVLGKTSSSKKKKTKKKKASLPATAGSPNRSAPGTPSDQAQQDEAAKGDGANPVYDAQHKNGEVEEEKEEEEEQVATNEEAGPKKKKKKKKKKAAGGGDGVSGGGTPTCPGGAGSKIAPARGVTGFTDSYVR